MGKVHGKSADDFNGEEAATELKDAMKGFGTDEEAIVKVLTSHTNDQRQEISSAYKTLYGEDLEAELKSELGGDLEDMVMALMTPARVYDARELRKAMKGAGTDEKTIIEIMCTRCNDEVETIKQIYEEEFERNLEEDLKTETSGHFEKLLVSQCNAGREEFEDVDDDQAEADAQEIFDAGEGQLGTDESAINMVLCTRGYRQLKATFAAYERLAGKDIEEAITSECTGSLEDGYLALVKSVKDIVAFFAERLYDAMHGAGTDDDTLIRVMASRSEIDLDEIEEAYSRMYEKTLAEAVDSDCHGKYKDILVAVLNAD